MEMQKCRSKAIIRILLFTLLLTALHFLYVLMRQRKDPSSPSCTGGDACLSQWTLLSASFASDALKPRYNFRSYEDYLQLQLKKTLNTNLRKLWTSKDWRRKVDVFAFIFKGIMRQGLLKPRDKALCIAARVGQEVLALREMGVDDAIGIDLVPSPPLLIQGDMHGLPFGPETFDFEFSNAFDHALFPALFVSEVERTLKPGGVVVLHLALNKRTDKYSANDLHIIAPLLALFSNFDVVHTKTVDAFGLDTEVALRKRLSSPHSASRNSRLSALKCPLRKSVQDVLDKTEPLILEEPLKPWLAYKENAKKLKYLPSLQNISHHNNYVYVDVGARSYSSSIGSWFLKQYPKQNKEFIVYAVEADKSFAGDYVKRKNVRLLPYAAWIRNETLVFGANAENRQAEGIVGMGRIQGYSKINGLTGLDREEFQIVQGFDFAEWLKTAVNIEDFVVIKMDIEGTEFDLLPRMFETGAICLVDELFLECHYNRWQRKSPKRTPKFNKSYNECLSLFEALRRNGVIVHQWW